MAQDLGLLNIPSASLQESEYVIGSSAPSAGASCSSTPLAFSNQDTEFVKFLASIGSSMKEFADFDPAEGPAPSSIPRLTWKSVLQQPSPKQHKPANQQFTGAFDECESEVVFNEDGTATINLPRSFLENAKKKWDTSCIGHFIGGSFPFKFVKDKVTKMWGNMGLQNVFFSSKGYFTFKFGTVEEMEKVLALNSVNIGGKRLYLGPWSDGSQFKRNAIKSVSTWIRLIDVPHSYWSVEGLGNIAKVVGKPICLDNQTALLNPMKFAGVMVQLKYGTTYPRAVWVPVINEEDGSIVKVKVGIEYSAVPQSCKFCQAFGHPESKCESNPLYAQKKDSANAKKDANVVDPTDANVVDSTENNDVEVAGKADGAVGDAVVDDASVDADIVDAEAVIVDVAVNSETVIEEVVTDIADIGSSPTHGVILEGNSVEKDANPNNFIDVTVNIVEMQTKDYSGNKIET